MWVLQEVLEMYMRELPTMNYAANTGKQSMFLEKCVMNGYITFSFFLLLKIASSPLNGFLNFTGVDISSRVVIIRQLWVSYAGNIARFF